MPMKKPFYVLLLLSIFVFSSSCSLDDGPNFHFEPLRIVSADLPESFEFEQTYQITVNFELPDSCTSFFDFEVSKIDTTTRNIVVFGMVRTDQEVCFWNGEGEDGEQQYFDVIIPVN